jgi:hypothetical protein
LIGTKNSVIVVVVVLSHKKKDFRAYTRARPSMEASESGRTPDKLLLFNFLSERRYLEH